MNILSLQGGGCLGFGQALTLQELEKRASKPCWQLFDIVAGTSVGSITGACIASGVPAATIVEFFTKYAPDIFSHSWIDHLEALDGPLYGAGKLEAALMATLGQRTLKDCKTRFIATAYDYATDRIVQFDSGKPSWRDKNLVVIGNDSPVQLWQICRASSAAQTYFSAYQLGDMVLLDGGNTSDNAPDMLALAESFADWMTRFSQGSVKMLSLGSGDTRWNVNAARMISPSPIRAGLETIKIVFAAGEDAQVSKARKILGPNHYRLEPDLGDGIAIDDAEGCLTKIPPAIAAMLAKNSATLDEFIR